MRWRSAALLTGAILFSHEAGAAVESDCMVVETSRMCQNPPKPTLMTSAEMAERNRLMIDKERALFLAMRANCGEAAEMARSAQRYDLIDQVKNICK